MTYPPQQPWEQPPQQPWQQSGPGVPPGPPGYGYGQQPVPYPADPGPAPGQVRLVFWLVIAQLVIGIVVGIPIAYLGKDEMLAQQPATPGVDAETIWLIGFVFGVVLVVVVYGAWLLFAIKLVRGRNWARVTLMVLTGVGLLVTPFNLLLSGNGVMPLMLVSAVPSVIISVVVLVLLFKEPAKSWTPAKTAYLKAVRAGYR